LKKTIYNKPWFVYIVECQDGTLYTGIARNVEERVKTHNRPSSNCKYTRIRQPVKLVYQERHKNHAQAWKREKEIKGFTREQKLGLIERKLF